MDANGLADSASGAKRHRLLRAAKKDQIWQRQFVDQTAEALHRELESRIDAEGLSCAVAWAERELDRCSRRTDYLLRLKSFLYCMELLRARRDYAAGLSDERVEQLFRQARRILESQGIKPTTSRLAHLYRDLHCLRSDLCADRGENWSAAWERLLGYYKSHRETEAELVLPPASLLGNEGKLSSPVDDNPEDPVIAIRAARLRGELEQARRRFAQQWSLTADDERRLRLQWERACLDTVATGSLTPMARLVRRGLAHHRSPWLLEFTLWSKVCKSKEWLTRAPRVRSIRRLFGFDSADADETLFFRGAQALERCYENEILFSSRLESLGEVLREAERLRSRERLLLLWAAAGRWLIRVKQESLARAVLMKYRAMSHRFSDGLNTDALGLMGDADVTSGSSIATSDELDEALASNLPESKWRRLTEFSKMSAEMAWAGGKQWLCAKKGEGTEQASLAMIDIAVRYMSRLKGPFMKVGQWASYSAFGVSDEGAEILSMLQDRAEPIAAERIREAVAHELRQPLTRLFSDWEDRPLATGSVGQVHRARTREGRDVVVKVQYPGIDEVMANDLFCVSLLKPVLGKLMPHWKLTDLFREIRARMADECDYRKEARHQLCFQRNFASDPDIWIPDVIQTHSARRVLTSEYVPGKKLSELGRDGTLGERSRAAETIMRSHWESALRFRYFNSDPHPGNFLICDKRVAILDFGSVKQWSEDSCWGIREITTSFVEGDPGMYQRGMFRAGLVAERGAFDAQAMFDRLRGTLVGWVQEDRPIELTREVALDYVRACTLDNPEFYRSVHITDECLLLFRAHWGLFGTLGLLRPQLNWRRVFLAVVRDLETIPALSVDLIA